MTSYRYPSETAIFGITILVLLVILVISAGLTVCLVPLAVLVIIGLSYYLNKSHHQALLQSGMVVSPQRSPELAALAQQCINRLQTPGQVQFIVLPQPQLNAFTFGFSNPKAVVLFDALFKVMDKDELRFIIGHELGHVALGHAWLNTLLGGMAGVPISLGAAVVLTLAFRWWNRACEYSADRAGLLACGSPHKAISALVKLEAGMVRSQEQMERALQAIDAEDDSLLNVLGETLASHPLTIRRINEIKKYTRSLEYQHLLAEVNRRG